jgi:hypothetical protein
MRRLMRPEGFEKGDLPGIAERSSLAQVGLFMHRVASQEAFTKNINDMASDGTGKLVELTAKSRGTTAAAKAWMQSSGKTWRRVRWHKATAVTC